MLNAQAASGSASDAATLFREYLRMSAAERRKRFLSTFDAAHSYHLGQRTVQRLVLEGEVAAVKLGKHRYLVDSLSLEAYLFERNTSNAGALA